MGDEQKCNLGSENQSPIVPQSCHSVAASASVVRVCLAAMGKGGNLRGGMMGRGVAASRTSVFELCTGTRGNSSESSAAPTRRVLRWVLFVLLVDVGLSVAAQWLVRGRLVWAYSLKGDCSDLVAAAVGRAAVLPLAAVAAYRSWRAAAADPGAAARDGGYELLDGGDAEGAALAARKRSADFRRDAWLALLFVLASVCQGYVGVKLCVFDLSAHPRNATPIAIAVGLTTICVNVEAWLLANVVQLRTRLLASVAPGLHKHALEYSMATNNWCDLCDRCASLCV